MLLIKHKIKRYGWVPDSLDQRDDLYAAPVVELKKLLPKVDLRSQCPKVIYDQGQLGSCTGNAIACAIQFDCLKQEPKPDFIPSRGFIYYNERDIEGTVASDSGAQLRDGINSVSRLGDCPQTEWPYDSATVRDQSLGDLLSRCSEIQSCALPARDPDPEPDATLPANGNGRCAVLSA